MSEKIRVLKTTDKASIVSIEMGAPTVVLSNTSIYEAEKIFERREAREYQKERSLDFKRCRLVLHYAALSGAKLGKMYNEGANLHFVFEFATKERARFFSEGLTARINELENN